LVFINPNYVLSNIFLAGILFIYSCESSQSLPDPLEAGWKGQSVCHLISENDKVRILKCVFPPGVGHETHIHEPHVGYTLKGGKFRINDADGEREVAIPDDYTFNNDTTIVHQVLNIGQTTAEFLIIEYK